MKRGKDHRTLPDYHDGGSKDREQKQGFSWSKICLGFLVVTVLVYLFSSVNAPVDSKHEKPLFNNAAILRQLRKKEGGKAQKVQNVQKDVDSLLAQKPKIENVEKETGGGKYSEEGRPDARRDARIPSLGVFDPPISPSIAPTAILDQYYLVIGINTVARFDKDTKKYKTYVADAIQSLRKQLDAFYTSGSTVAENFIESTKRVLVFVQDNTDDENPPFDVLAEKEPFYKGDHYDVILFKNRQRFLDPFRDVPSHNYKAPDNTVPGHKARQQNADVISYASHALHHIKFDNFLFMEDDFLTCPNMPAETFRVLDEIEEHDKKHCGMRISYGMNGILLSRSDLTNFVNYMSHHIDLFPVDLMIRKFLYDKTPLEGLHSKPLPYQPCRAAKRDHYTYKAVLQEHIGDISTFEERNKDGFRPPFPKCGFSMALVWNLNEDEIFDNRRCMAWSVTPCSFSGAAF
jgi:hypothetical protein